MEYYFNDNSLTSIIQINLKFIKEFAYKPSGSLSQNLFQFLQHEATWSISTISPLLHGDASPLEGYPEHSVLPLLIYTP